MIALSWFQWMHRNHLITSWSSLLHALETYFAPTFYDDPQGTLVKLTQRGSVNDYLDKFERLANRVTGLPPSFLLSCFISDLTPEVRREVQALQPVSLPQAISLAKLQEEKLDDRRRSYRPCPTTTTPTHQTPPPLLPLPSPTTTHPPLSPPKQPLKRLTPDKCSRLALPRHFTMTPKAHWSSLLNEAR